MSSYYHEEWTNTQDDKLKIIKGINCRQYHLLLSIGIYPDITLKRSKDLNKVERERDLFIKSSYKKWTQTKEADPLGFVSYYKEKGEN
jgi:hypothetical protein